jgi:hypothetical protein
MHLDFSNMGLSEAVLLRIVKALKTSESLLGVHLSGNEGLCQELFDKTKRLLGCLYEKNHRVNIPDIVRDVRKTKGHDSTTPLAGEDIDPKEVRLLA